MKFFFVDFRCYVERREWKWRFSEEQTYNHLSRKMWECKERERTGIKMDGCSSENGKIFFSITYTHTQNFNFSFYIRKTSSWIGWKLFAICMGNENTKNVLAKIYAKMKGHLTVSIIFARRFQNENIFVGRKRNTFRYDRMIRHFQFVRLLLHYMCVMDGCLNMWWKASVNVQFHTKIHSCMHIYSLLYIRIHKLPE